MDKNYFNDTRPSITYPEWECASCRCKGFITLQSYPHGPQLITVCPVCKTDLVPNEDGSCYIQRG